MSPFLYTFLGGSEYGGGRQFFKFFQNILIVNYCIFKRCKFHKGFKGQFFLMGPEVKNYCNTKMPQHFHRLFSVLKIELKT
jgi:hypothetical protein